MHLNKNDMKTKGFVVVLEEGVEGVEGGEAEVVGLDLVEEVQILTAIF